MGVQLLLEAPEVLTHEKLIHAAAPRVDELGQVKAIARAHGVSVHGQVGPERSSRVRINIGFRQSHPRANSSSRYVPNGSFRPKADISGGPALRPYQSFDTLATAPQDRTLSGALDVKEWLDNGHQSASAYLASFGP